MTEKLPSVVIVGRPNVGKSTIFNRLTGTRRSIVTDEPGITRDRIYGTATWQGRRFEVVDTGGIVPDDKAAIPREILRQAQVAIEGASELLLVVDVRAGLTPLDAELARLLRRTGKPLAILANKVDTQMQESLAAPFYELSNDVFPVSAEHGYGFDALLESITARLGAAGSVEEEGAAPERPEKQDQQVNVAIIGRPNVGKSTMLNRLSGVDRAIVSDIPGTTRDAVDTVVEHGGRTYRFVDTAGIRRKGKTNLVAEKMSVMMARRHLEQADVALLIVDASLGVTANDANIAGYAEESGRSVIIVMNKWDLALEAAAEKAKRELEHQGPKPHVVETSFRQRSLPASKQASKSRTRKHTSLVRKKAVTGRVDPAQLVEDYEKIVRTRFKFLDYAPIVFVSAKTGERTEKLFDLIDRVADARQRRISTGELNRWVAEVDLDRGTSPAARRVKIYYVTQASTSPPTFILFTNQSKRLHFSYERFLENLLRKSFDFLGTPIRFLQRLKERRERGARPSSRTRTAH
ncbi:MAG TPA: ribosome biogenesis GTPase Der [Candidatus Acidoferrales bacterium]|jgi:GTP-binding protein|nr:ribosome biogenesis GTPase Der [Candidatus Acidoferrales bacterium]